MARVSNLTVDGKPVRRVEGFIPNIPQATVEATAVQLRILAQESRELVIDKLYAGTARPPGRARIDRPPRTAQRSDIPGNPRRPFRHPALADATVERKAREDKDGRRLIAEGDYTYGIEVFKGERDGMVYYIVRPKPAPHRSGVSHRVLAAIHEFGTSTIPPRPHWGPVFRIVSQELARRGPDVLAEALRRAIRERR